ncbi:hypothetical protein [Paraburkholderia strydomiana]
MSGGQVRGALSVAGPTARIWQSSRLGEDPESGG